MIGSDFYDPEKDFTLESVSQFAGFYRRMLGQLNPAVARRLAYQNLEGLFAGADLNALTTTTNSIAQTTTLTSSNVASLSTTRTTASALTVVPSSETVPAPSRDSAIIAGLAITVLTLIGVFYLRRRGK